MDYEEKQRHKASLNGRNTESAFEAIQAIDIYTRETRSMLETMNAAIALLNQRITVLETEINKRRIAEMGTGPTQCQSQ